MKHKALHVMSVFGVACLFAVAADALTADNYKLEYAAISCWGNSLARNGTSVINNSGSSQWLICPVGSEYRVTSFVGTGFYGGAGLQINASHGTNCYANIGDAAGNYWSVPAPVIRQLSGFDEFDWTQASLGLSTGGINLSVQCFLPPNKSAFQYAVSHIWDDE